MLWGGGRRTIGRTIGVRLGPGVGVELAEWLSLHRDSEKLALDRTGVDGRVCFSDDLVGELLGLLFPSPIQPMSRTEPGSRDCMRRWATRARSGEGSVPRLVRGGTMVDSRIRSLSAAWADWIALEVPAREVKVGDCGGNGSGGGARSGSELSHLDLPVSLRQSSFDMSVVDRGGKEKIKADLHGDECSNTLIRRGRMLMSQGLLPLGTVPL